MKAAEPPAPKNEPGAAQPKQRPKKAGMTRKGFGELIKRAFTQETPKAK